MSKQKTILNYISTVVFIFLLAMPILFFDKENTVSKNEKRDLAMFPNIISSGKINKKLFKEIDVYISDRFGFRQDLIQIDNNLKYKVLGDSGNDRVVLGKKNFLY